MRNFLTWTFTPLDVRLLAFLCEFWDELPLRNRFWQSAELLCLKPIGSLEHGEEIKHAWLEDVVEMVGLPRCSFDGYEMEIFTLSLNLELRRFLRSNEGIDVTLVWFFLKPSKFVVEFDKGKSARWFLLPRWIRNVTFSSSTWLLLPPLPFVARFHVVECHKNENFVLNWNHFVKASNCVSWFEFVFMSFSVFFSASQRTINQY